MRLLLLALLLATPLSCQEGLLDTDCHGPDDCPPGYRCAQSGHCTRIADASVDSGASDAHLPDVPRPDIHIADTRAPDTDLPDAHLPDSAPLDTAAPDRSSPPSYTVLVGGDPVACGERRAIAIDGNQVDGPQPGFPLLFDSAVSADLRHDLKNVASGGAVFSPSGHDILFAEAEGMEVLPHEIERYVHASGELLVWIRIDLTGNDQTLFLYFGCPGIEAGTERPTAVWDSDFIGVWHMAPRLGTTCDSTGNGLDATNNGATPVADAWIDGAFEFSRSENDHLLVEGSGGSLSLGAFTVEVWLWTPDANVSDDYFAVAQSRHCDPYESWTIGIADESDYANRARFSTIEHGNGQFIYGSHLTDGAWHHLAGVRTDTQLHIYVDGTIENSDIRIGSTIVSSSDLIVGSDACVRSEAFNGRVDEVRLSGVARSTGWIATSHSNQRDPGGFYTVEP